MDATLLNASPNPSTTPSSVADMAVFSLRFAFGTTSEAGRGRPPSASPCTRPAASRAAGSSAVAKGSPSCHVCSLTGIPFPPPGRSAPWVGANFRRPCGTVRSSDFFWVISFRSFVLRPTAIFLTRGTQKISLGNVNRLHDHPVANTPRSTHGYWDLSLSADLPAAERLTALHFRSERPCTYGFHQTPPHGHSSHLWRRVATGTPEQRPCLIGVRFPP